MKLPKLTNLSVTGTTVGDVHFPKVKLLLPFDGSNGATSTTDSSNTNNSVTFVGTAQLSTAQSKFGGSSLLLDGNSDYIYIANDDLDFSSTESFTLEFWVYFNNIDDGNIVNFYSDYSGASNGMSIDKSTGNVLRAHNGDSTRITGTTTVSAGQWYHIALSGTSGSYKLFLNGTQEGSTSSNGFTGGTTNKYIGTFYWAGLGGAVRLLNGYIEDFRITKGEARYTSNFTPPTSAHLTSAGDVNKHIVVNSDADGVAIGTGGINQARIAKAWCNWDQTGTIAIRSSYNISSISDLGTGRTDVNFSTAMADTNYTAAVYGNHSSSNSAYTNFSEYQSYGAVLRTVNDIEVTHYKAGTGYIDSKQADLIIFGN
tara:strand:- start:3668 stop:4777 length:1110 start_codon:yes stop_codon:yes gene_type:complete